MYEQNRPEFIPERISDKISRMSKCMTKKYSSIFSENNARIRWHYYHFWKASKTAVYQYIIELDENDDTPPQFMDGYHYFYLKIDPPENLPDPTLIAGYRNW